MLHDVGDFLYRQFARKNDTRKSHRLRLSCTLKIVYRHLRACVNRQIRKVFSDDSRQKRVLNNDAVYARVVQFAEHCNHFCNFILPQQRVDSNIYFAARCRAVRNACEHGKFFQRKVCRVRPRGKARHSKIQRVCAILDSRYATFKTSCW